jgi:hypothetical protein
MVCALLRILCPPARNVVSHRELLVETGRAGQTLDNAPPRLSTVEFEQIANITASSMVGTSSAPAPNLTTGVSWLTSAPLQHPSPSAQHSPATSRAVSSHVLRPGQHTAEKSRASIACTQCRRNKTRCRNKNDESPCQACEERGKGHTCNYTDAAQAGSRPGSAFKDAEVSVPTLPRPSF